MPREWTLKGKTGLNKRIKCFNRPGTKRQLPYLILRRAASEKYLQEIFELVNFRLMKKYLSALSLTLLFGCSHVSMKQEPSISNPDSLAAQLAELKELYRPGLGEIMGGIQTHHAKLWYAAINDNWKLADYEIAEIKERIDEAAEIETNRPEVKTIQ